MSIDNFFNKNKNKEAIIENFLCANYNSYYRLAFSYTHNRDDALDIVQEGAYKAIRNSASLKDVEYAQTWIYRIMLNEIFRLLGKKNDLLPDSENMPVESVEDVYEDIDLKRALDTMNPLDRAVIQLRFFEDMTIDQIAGALNENKSTVKSMLYRGLKKLKIELMEIDAGV